MLKTYLSFSELRKSMTCTTTRCSLEKTSFLSDLVAILVSQVSSYNDITSVSGYIFAKEKSSFDKMFFRNLRIL